MLLRAAAPAIRVLPALLLLLLLPARVASFAASSAREVVSFDFGWRHRRGLHGTPGAHSLPPVHPDPGPSPAEASIDFDDSAWDRVQLPHDGLIGAAPPSNISCASGCSGRSYIPRSVLWYRKRFVVPASWATSLVWLAFAGSFRSTRVYVNGALVAMHDCGYTPFRVRLDNVSGVHVGGAPNVLAVFVDPDNGDEGGRTRGSGWWY